MDIRAHKNTQAHTGKAHVFIGERICYSKRWKIPIYFSLKCQ